jgi:TIR domain
MGSLPCLFVSYTAQDKEWAEWLAYRIEDGGLYRALLQEWDFVPGENYVQRMNDAVQTSLLVVLVMSEAYFRSACCRDEWTAALVGDRTGGGRILPVRVEDCEIPALLRPRVYVDLVETTETEAADRLARGIDWSVRRAGSRSRDRVAFPGEHVVVQGRFEADGVAFEREIVRIVAAKKRLTDPATLTDVATRVEAILASLVGSQNLGSPRKAALADAVDEIVGWLVSESREAATLLRLRARLRSLRGRWPGAVDDLQRYADTTDTPDPTLMLEAGTHLMTLGSYGEANRLLAETKAATDFEVRSRARELRIWIEDYQGRHLEAARGAAGLLHDLDRAGAGPDRAAGTRHRMARALFAASTAGVFDRDAAERAFEQMDRAAAESDNPFNAFWMYRIAEALGRRDRHLLWDRAQEAMGELSEPARGHILLVASMRHARTESRLAQRHCLREALELWSKHPYPKGAFDASLRLGTLLTDMAVTRSDRLEAVRVLRLAECIAKNLGLPERDLAGRRLEAAADRLSYTGEYLRERSDELIRESDLATLLSPRTFRMPGDVRGVDS